ncbi:Heat shock protein Hsp90-like protein [Ruminiclostridium papyrosolvens DSM 2782]|uniref:Heat shock protein Hsp90-like protein n=1 Tax=Ruminiclostridium papyrosolvens DSM 2782 TaxID=588581 RepID=F1TG85_9FIRM|nr:molecular chaperone HtpG [Ruminiclostridium papyrosolvens]EGD46704.1 Heat shock protein Hsp90-like protein [Ruminiclostridium papyrosolvens DSM 2782]WES35854.1 molecular chaperone HtpG [Ruminiclostridium papyrosolvens DSM 2782]
MKHESGSISINTENIFPIIKKWLYSEKDIFIRELVSNASDAISKMKKLDVMGEAELPEGNKFEIKVIVNKNDKTIKVIDNGLGMTEEEVKKYINQIAFSGAVDFLEKYKDKSDDGQIIGHFGLGFYSAFMVSQRVQIDTLSYQKDAAAVRWVSDGGTEFEMSDSDKSERGTTITLYLSDDSLEFTEEYTMRTTLEKYFAFLPYELYLEDAAKVEEKKEETKEEEKEGDEKEVTEPKKPEPLNDTQPLWLKNPKDCTDEDYKKFYSKVFHDFNEPLFWIHLNMDYPFNLKGILYFPKLKHEFETNEGQIKLYYNQVFVADNIKEVIPEFLLLLKGVLDCPDLPLNVSRSFLQNDGYVNKISTHITKKVADKLTSIFENDRESYNKYWDDINPFVKYGCLREEKFYDRVKDVLIFKSTKGGYTTLKEYLENNKDKHENKVFYVSDENQQAQYIKLFNENGMEAVILSNMIDNHFMSLLESKGTGLQFNRIDADISESMKQENTGIPEADVSYLEGLFKETVNDEKLKIQVESLKNETIPAVVLLSEQSRRMQEMSKMFGGMDMGHMFPKEQTLVLNSSNKLVKALLDLKEKDERKEDVKLVSEHIYDLAMMSHQTLGPEAMAKFIQRSNEILMKVL